MLSDFLIFYAPFIVVIASITAAFWFADKDEAVSKNQ